MLPQEESNDFYPIILTAPQSDCCSSMDLDELLPIEMEMLNSTSSIVSKGIRNVSFGAKDSVAFIESSEDWTDEERDNTWFTPNELDRIKKRAIKLCKHESLGLAIPVEDSTRGMGIYFPTRKEAHAEFVYQVLLAYHDTYAGDSDYVAHLAEVWSVANKEMAHTVAVRDMYEAYFPNMLEKQPKKKTSGVRTPTSHSSSLSPIRESPRKTVSSHKRDLIDRH
ncbi:unnamed protein product [Cylindrotheca closterium]|uniref:Uncharacterized protein n=1 Tax=Cylindrotheca closterium TaxID=2856 RepID=A0AAD2FD25_9STRA|nr:unnamed protein product [Cylindrotheca closterium]